jgi:hypothetical protein
VDRRLREYFDTMAGSESGRLGQTVTTAAQGVASSVGGTAGEVGTKVQDTISKAVTAVTEAATRAGTQVPSLPGELPGLIRCYPIATLLVGLGIGYLLGRTFSYTDLPGEGESSPPPKYICPICGFLLSRLPGETIIPNCPVDPAHGPLRRQS